ncbi:hypothetical protein AB0P19_02205 [Microbacterium oleivorans]|uniref:hypothetical protein n=1 Tax=Microbacterium oleivorans TaxID=273677 RepID=UPI003416FBC7
MSRDVPLTSSDLRHIADKVDEILTAVNPDDEELSTGDWRWGLKVIIWNDGGDIDDVAGEVAPHGDGWLGFYPNAITR